MRRFILAVSLLTLTACGGSEQVSEEPQGTEPSQSEVSASASTVCTGDTFDCYCAQFKVKANCPTQSYCYWDASLDRCLSSK